MVAIDLRRTRIAMMVGASYGLLAWAAIELTRLSGGIALMWVANGVLLAALASSSRQRWPWLFGVVGVMCFGVTLITRHSVIAGIGFTVANLAETWLAAWLLRHWNAQRGELADLRSVILFGLAGGVIGPVVGAAVGAATCVLAFGYRFAPTALDWWFGHGLGMLIAAPLAMVVTLPELRHAWRAARPREVAVFAGLILLVAAVSVLVFAQDRLPLLFLPALPVMIATFRLGRVGAAVALVTVAAIGGALTVGGHGPVHLIHGTPAMQLQFFQFYLGVLFLLALPTAAMLTGQRKLYARLAANEAALRLLADHSTDVLLNLDVDGGIRFASPSVRMLGGYEPDALVGRNAVELIEPEHRGLVKRAHLDALATPETNVTVEYQARRQDGTIAWFETNTRAVRGPDGGVAGVVSAIRDVSHRKSIERQLRLAADTDPLTGLANRRPFIAELDEAIRASGRGAAAVAAMIDIDHFKRVNDRFGHAAGDAALVQLAELCRRQLRAADTVARLGGEEFAVLLGGTGLDEASAIMERLRLAIAAQPIIAPSAPLFRITASFGLAEISPDRTSDAVLAAADRALYAAKHAGRNRLKIAA